MLRDVDASGDQISETKVSVIVGIFCVSLVFLYLVLAFPRDQRWGELPSNSVTALIGTFCAASWKIH